MQRGKPSRTAWAAAAHRAAHQILEQGRIFADPLALRILGEDAEAVARKAEERPSARRMRIFIAVEDALCGGCFSRRGGARCASGCSARRGTGHLCLSQHLE